MYELVVVMCFGYLESGMMKVEPKSQCVTHIVETFSERGTSSAQERCYDALEVGIKVGNSVAYAHCRPQKVRQ